MHGILFLFAQSILVILFLLLTYYMCIYLTYGTNKIDKQTSSAMTVSFSITLQSLLLSKRDLQYSENLVNQGCSNRMLLKASFLFRNFFYNTPSNASHSACYRPAAAILSNSFSKYATWLLVLFINNKLSIINTSCFSIPYLHKSHNTPLLPPKHLHRHCFRLLLGHLHVPGEIANNDYANFFFEGRGRGGGG